MISLHSPAQPSSEHARKGGLPLTEKPIERVVTLLDIGIVRRTMLISWGTVDSSTPLSRIA